MSTPRPQKWDWSAHLPKMVELYKTQMSIPDIYKAIQCAGFEPCQRSVYNQFKSMGFPTDPVGRQKHLDAIESSSAVVDNNANFNNSVHNASTPFVGNGYLHSSLSPLPEESLMMETSSPWYGYDAAAQQPNQSFGTASPHDGRQSTHPPMTLVDSSQGILADSQPVTHTMAPCVPNEGSSMWSSPIDNLEYQNFGSPATPFGNASEFPGAEIELKGASYFGIEETTCEPQPFTGNHQHHSSMNAGSSGLNWQHEMDNFTYGTFHSNGSVMDLDGSSMFPQDEVIEPIRRRGSSIDLKIPFQNFINSSSSTGTRSKIRSLFNKKSNGSFRGKKKYANSQFTHNTEDSGYASGFGSCLTLEEVQQINTQSMKEFNELYRVACHVLHEPRRKEEFKDIQTCAHCRYSSIHNLGWSARYLKLEVFLSELKLEGVYDFGALDAAGNTALHYAAAAGAGFQHLKALIDAGVNPYVANTAGELFVYCLRPLQPFTLEPNSDCLKSNDLIKLLELLDPQRVFGWRDNNGQTVLHALALKISEPDLKAHIFQIFSDSGFPPTVPDRFGKTAADVAPLTYDCHGQVIEPTQLPTYQQPGSYSQTNTSDTTPSAPSTAADEWTQKHVEQIKSQTIVVGARRQPSYVDHESGDNVIHALSRLKPNSEVLQHLEKPKANDPARNLYNRESNYILLNLEYFISRGADLNLHNRKGSYPLKSIICDRPPEENETGATLSKFLDAILWKDHSNRVKNHVIVNMKDRDGATALHYAAMRGRPDSVRSLIEAGANVNARTDNGSSVLQATSNALDEAVKNKQELLAHLLREVISHLEHAGAERNPTSILERGIRRT
ncbi:hypothetical protein BGZ60DRAFT_485198 [Tricladium varicosporioides]|nr:hypothetical protein BGZ60DRAFT_485198 [Hymenoscyphus varicosporioides]